MTTNLTSFYLTDDELVEVTGYTRRAEQINWLKRNGWTFALSAISKPIVSRRHAEIMLGGIVDTTAPEVKPRNWAPNLAAIRRA